MKPVWIKYWGLIPMTRRGYLISLAGAGLVAMAVLTVGGLAGRLPPFQSLWQEIPVRARTPWWEYWFYNNLYRLIGLCLIAQALDTFVILRRFARKEAEHKATPP